MKISMPVLAATRQNDVILILLAALFSWMGVSPVLAAQTAHTTGESSHENKLTTGTLLPIILRTSVSFDKCKPGQILHGKIAQDVPLPKGLIIRKGSDIEGHIVEVIPAGNGTGVNVSLQFDKLYMAGQLVLLVTNLRAIADDPHALWVFSAYARGAYGIDNLLIAHAGKTAPVGTIVLASQTHNFKLTNGEALLLLVD
jgi:hypothetical protein